MNNNNLFSSDSYISQYIKNILLKEEALNTNINNLLAPKFNNEDIISIKEGTYIFSVEEFLFITKIFNINTNELFIQIYNK